MAGLLQGSAWLACYKALCILWGLRFCKPVFVVLTLSVYVLNEIALSIMRVGHKW